jgi:hypothetical protein
VEILLKKEKAGWWSHLLKDKNKYKQQCQVDWAHFKSEDDDEEEAAGKGFDGTHHLPPPTSLPSPPQSRH